jgi:hypothetical protein
MFAFLDEYYEMTKSDDIGALLGSMSLLGDGNPAGPAIPEDAIPEDWNDAVQKVIEHKVNADLVLKK